MTNNLNFPTIAHDDHPMTKEQLAWIQTHPEIKAMEHGSFICKVFPMPESLGTIPSAIYGPTVGDDPVTNEEVHYITRGERHEVSRMIDKPFRDAQNVCVIGLVGKVAFTMYGTQCLEPAPREVWDKGLQDDREALLDAEYFWNTHALSDVGQKDKSNENK